MVSDSDRLNPPPSPHAEYDHFQSPYEPLQMYNPSISAVFDLGVFHILGKGSFFE